MSFYQNFSAFIKCALAIKSNSWHDIATRDVTSCGDFNMDVS